MVLSCSASMMIQMIGGKRGIITAQPHEFIDGRAFVGRFFTRCYYVRHIHSDLVRVMARKKALWLPEIGTLATYIGGGSKLARGGYNVRVVAETCAERMVVEAIGRSGLPIRFTVKRKNLAPLQPGLFD